MVAKDFVTWKIINNENYTWSRLAINRSVLKAAPGFKEIFF